MIAPVSRILVRYIAGFLVLKSVIPQDVADMIANDPDITVLVGGALAIGVEGFYALARKYGWSK